MFWTKKLLIWRHTVRELWHFMQNGDLNKCLKRVSPFANYKRFNPRKVVNFHLKRGNLWFLQFWTYLKLPLSSCFKSLLDTFLRIFTHSVQYNRKIIKLRHILGLNTPRSKHYFNKNKKECIVKRHKTSIKSSVSKQKFVLYSEYKFCIVICKKKKKLRREKKNVSKLHIPQCFNVVAPRNII